MGETGEYVLGEPILVIEAITNELARGTKHFDARKVDQGIEEPVTDMKEILELIRDGHLIIEPREPE